MEVPDSAMNKGRLVENVMRKTQQMEPVLLASVPSTAVVEVVVLISTTIKSYSLNLKRKLRSLILFLLKVSPKLHLKKKH